MRLTYTVQRAISLAHASYLSPAPLSRSFSPVSVCIPNTVRRKYYLHALPAKYVTQTPQKKLIQTRQKLFVRALKRGDKNSMNL